jgi:hypothetical protein
MLNLNGTINGTVQAESISQDMKDMLLPRKLTVAMVMKDMKCEGKLPIETRKWHLQPIFINHSNTNNYKNNISTRRRGK